MNNELKTTIKHFKNGKCFNKVLLDLSKLESKQLIIFLKATSAFNPRNQQQSLKLRKLWQTEIFIDHYRSLISSDLKEDMLFSFFSKPDFINEVFFNILQKNDPNLLIKHSRLSKSFFKDKYFELYHKTLRNNNNIDLRNLFIEFNFLQQKAKEWNKLESSLINTIKYIDPEEILIQACSYLEKYKRADFSHYNNLNNLISFRTNFLSALNHILTKLNLSIHQEKYDSILAFNKRYISELPPINDPLSVIKKRYSPIEEISDEKKLLRRVFNFMMEKRSFEYSVDKYAVNFADFEIIENNEAILKENIEFRDHRINIHKYTYSEFFFFNKGAGLFENSTEYYNINSSLAYWDYLKLPKEVTFDKLGQTVSIKKILLLLQTFSSWLIPLKRKIIYNDNGYCSVMHNKVPVSKAFKEIFTNKYLNCFEFEELINNLSIYFKWDEVETRSIIDYLSIDLLDSREDDKVDTYTHPFLRIGSKIYWLSNLFEDFRWPIHIHKRMINEKIDHTTQTTQIEKSLSQDFISAGFNSISGYKYKYTKQGGVISGEIDTIAYQEGHLFLIEQKTTYIEENPNQKAIYHSKMITGKANSQLLIAIEYIKDNFNKIKEIKELNINQNINEIKITPLIVSNIFEYDGKKTDDNILKICDLTLKIILNNDWKDLLFISTKQIAKAFNHKYNSNTEFDIPITSYDNYYNLNKTKNYTGVKKREDTNLWSTKESCSPNDILKAINENKVWESIEKFNDFNTSSYQIKSPIELDE